MSNQKSYIVATIHEYDLERFGDQFYDKAPGERESDGKASVGIVFDPQLLEPVEEELCSQIVDALITEKDRERITRVLGDMFDDTRGYIYFRIYGDDEGILKYTRAVVKELIRRVSWLDCEDDHCDFYHSSLEFLVQVALVIDATDELKPLYDALVDRRDNKGCPYCDSGNELCYVPNVLEPYI